MATAAFELGGTTHRVEVPDNFFSLSEDEKRKQLMSLIGRGQEEPEEDRTAWETTKDIGKSVGGGMLTALHQLGRPQSAIAGGLFNIQEERMGLGGDVERSNWERYVNETLEAMKKGLTYEDEKRMQDLMVQANPEWVKEHPVLSTILGFGGDVLTDPLMYGTRFALLPIKGVAKLLAKTPVGAAVSRAADNPVMRAFNVYTGDKKKA